MSSQNIPTLLTVRRFAAKHEAFTEASLRWLIFKAGSPELDANHEHNSALNDAVVRVGRKVLIDEQKFFNWLLRK
jgi:hypothetical protein